MLSSHCRPAPVPSCAGSSDALWGGCCAKKVCISALKFSVQFTCGFQAVQISQQRLNHPHEPNLSSSNPRVPSQCPQGKEHRTNTVPRCCVKIHVGRAIHSSSSPAGDFSCREQQTWILIKCLCLERNIIEECSFTLLLLQQMQEPLPFLEVSSAKSIFSWYRSQW